MFPVLQLTCVVACSWRRANVRTQRESHYTKFMFFSICGRNASLIDTFFRNTNFADYIYLILHVVRALLAGGLASL